MKKVRLFLVFLVAFLFQSTLFRYFAVFGAAPNLVLVLVIVFSFFFDDFDGIAVGTVFGLLQDICFGQVTGITALVYFLMGISLQSVRVGVYRDNKIILLLLAAVCTLAYYAGCWCLLSLMTDVNTGFIYIMKKIPAAIIWNYIILLIVCCFARNRKGFTV